MRSLPFVGGLLIALITYVLVDAFTELPISLHWLIGIAAGLVASAGFAIWLQTRHKETGPDQVSRGT